jgi:hypothetical protein
VFKKSLNRLYYAADKFSPYHPIQYKTYLNSIHPPKSTSSQCSLSTWANNPLYAFLLYSIRATCHVHLILLDFANFAISTSYKSSLFSFLQPPDISFLFGPNILLSTLISNTLRLCSSFNVSDNVSYPLMINTKQIPTNINQ